MVVRFLLFLLCFLALAVSSFGIGMMSAKPHPRICYQSCRPGSRASGILSFVLLKGKHKMAITHDTNANFVGESTPNSHSFSFSTSGAGELIIASLFLGGGWSGTPSISGGGLTWTFITNISVGSTWVGCWYAYASSALSSASITFSWTSTINFGCVCNLDSFAGGASSSPYIEGTNSASPNSTSTTVTATAPGECLYMLGTFSSNSAMTPSAGFTSTNGSQWDGYDFRDLVAYNPSGVSGSNAISWSASGFGAEAIIGFAIKLGASTPSRRRSIWYLAQGKPEPERRDWWRRPSGVLVPQRAFADAA